MSNVKNVGHGGCVALIFIWVICAMLWPYTINSWLVYLDKEPAMLFWHGLLLALVPGLGQLTLPLAALTWILMLFI